MATETYVAVNVFGVLRRVDTARGEREMPIRKKTEGTVRSRLKPVKTEYTVQSNPKPED